MYAVNRPLSPPLPPLGNPLAAPVTSPTRAPRTRQAVRTKSLPHQAIAIETALKLTVNLGLSGVAIAALVQLIPHEVSQIARLQELQVASKTSTERLRTVQTNFQHYFDPYQSRSIMAEQTNRVDPKEKTIVLQRPSAGSLSYQINNLNDLSQQRVERSATGY